MSSYGRAETLSNNLLVQELMPWLSFSSWRDHYARTRDLSVTLDTVVPITIPWSLPDGTGDPNLGFALL